MSLSYNDILREFKKDFDKIKNKGFIESRRIHDTGIGKTFEDFMEIAENNSKTADYKGVIELKSARELSESKISLFTKSPSPRGANTKIRLKFGYPDKEFPQVKVLHTTLSGDTFNNCRNNFGFKFNIEESEENISILVKNLNSGEIDNSIEANYSFSSLRKIIEKKLKFIAFINAENKKIDGKEYFKFKEAIILSGLTFEKFLDGIKKGWIVYEFRIGAYKTGDKKGKTHDHGSGFRISKGNLKKVFNIKKLD